MKSKCSKPFQDSSFHSAVNNSRCFHCFFHDIRNILLCARTPFSFHSHFVFPSNTSAAKCRVSKGRAIILPSVGHITIYQWFAISEHAAVLLFEPRIEKNICFQPSWKGSISTYKKENDHKKRLLFRLPQCRESTESIWGARLSGAENTASTELSGGGGALAICRP